MSTGDESSTRRRPGPWVVALATIAAALSLYAGVIRLWDLDENPPGFWQDEASTALDAYLIWNTGRDLEGQLFPIYSRALGEYGLTLNRYIAAPFVGLIDQTPGIQRLPVALTGVLFVLVFALFVWRKFGAIAGIGALASATLAPMWIIFSRYSSEAIYLPFFLLAGFALFELGRDNPNRRWTLWLGAIALAASAYTYHAVKLILPLWMIGFLVYHAPLIRTLWAKGERKHLFGPAIVFALLVLPSVQAAFSQQAMARGKTVMAWNHYEGWALVLAIFDHYLSYFDPAFLFVRGGPNASQSIPRWGLLNLIDLPLILAGLFAVAAGKNRAPRTAWFFVFWFLLGPLPGGLSYERHNVGRSIAWLPSPMLLSGLGLSLVAEKLRTLPRARVAVAGAWVASLLVTCVLLTEAVLVIYKSDVRHNWQYEISEALRCALRSRTEANELIVVSPRLTQGQIFARFFYAEQPPAPGHDQAWISGDRAVVNPGELYVTPAHHTPRQGEKICTLTWKDGAPKSFVFGPAAN